MPLFDAKNFAEWTGGTWTRLPEENIRSVYHDTRKLQPGAMYVAMPGERVDGHDLIGQAVEAGAMAVLCLKGRAQPEIACLEVSDTGKALERLARGYRKLLNPKQMIGVTGSAGKTTVKDFLAAMLSEAGHTRCTQGNWNNFVGLPLSLLAMEPQDKFGVFELGMSNPGEIAGLSEILQPDAGLITSIGEAHLERLGSVEAVAAEKTSLLAALPANGLAVLDADSRWFEFAKTRCGCRIATVSMKGSADYEGEVLEHGLRVKDRQRGESIDLPVPFPGDHMLMNLLQAVAMVRECGLSAEMMVRGLEKYAPAPMRWQRVQLKKWQVINDAYNANPLSMRKSIRTFSELSEPGEKWLVLGGMGELGEAEKELHWVIGKELDAFGFTGVVLVGERASWMQKGIQKTPVILAGSREEAVRELTACVGDDAVLLLKASRSEQLELILQALQKNEENTV
ncbi:UDP-N-acetylmuramoyl-tripeptide--D-alanyl-D-alanine ligase [Kiritimatiellaeota bacterium B1221]|nr:UDP-N-acetylmuramoyl-tripeptide--D-alanyl-D-alanine ligase [Kiritimatiellaeota bacterium B1221]